MPVSELLTRRINARQVGMARIALGLAGILQAPESYLASRELHTLPGIVQAQELWWPQLPPGADNLLNLIWLLSSAALCGGFFARSAGAVLLAVMVNHIGRDQNLYLNHVYLMILMIFLLLFADPGRALSVDSWMGHRADTAAYWPAWLMKVQLTIVYVTASINKIITPAFMSGEILFRGFNLGPLERFPGLGPAYAWSVIVCQLFLAAGLWLPRFRGAALALGFAFHGTIWLTAPPSIYIAGLLDFAIIVWTAYLLHVPAERESVGLPRGLEGLRRWDWMGVFRAEADPGPATPAALRHALSVLPVGYLWAFAPPDWLLRRWLPRR